MLLFSTSAAPEFLIGQSQRLGVLIVDDDESERRLLCAGLGEVGLECWGAATGLEAIKLYPRLRDKISAIVLDLNMPGLSGADTLDHLRSIDPAVRVCILTGEVDQQLEQELLKLGAEQVLHKPISLNRLASTLRRPGKGRTERRHD